MSITTTVLLVILFRNAQAIDPYILKDIRDCLSQNQSLLCLKECALELLNQTINSDQSLNLYDVLDVVKDPDYTGNYTSDSEELSTDLQQRSLQLNDMLTEKIDEFIMSRVVKFNLGHIMEEVVQHFLLDEYQPKKDDGLISKIYKTVILSTLTSDGRGRKGNKKGGMLMMGGLAMAGMMAQLFMGKIAFMAGAALLVAKLALLLSTIIGFKKLSGGSSGGESHVVYASEPSGGSYGHSHGGWQRSHEDVADLPYSGYATTQDSNVY